MDEVDPRMSDQHGLPLDFLFRSMSDAVLIADADLVLQQVNPAATAMLGLPTEALIGGAVQRLFNMNPALMNLFVREGDQILDVRLPRRRLAVGMGKTLPGGQRLVMLQDVTEKRELESRREALVKAVAHDLRNPISAISGFADLVAKFGTLNEDQERFIERIRQTANKLYDVAGQLVDLAWIEAGMPLEHRLVHLPQVIEAAIAELRPLAKRAAVTIATSIQNPMPSVMGDPDRLQAVVRGLLHNAISYGRSENMIVIHAWEQEREVYCSVADRGIGIDDSELDLVFDRLYRSTDERVRDIPGGGLGLTLARTILRRHGGDIWVASNLGEGSTFTFVLPTARG